MQIKFKVECRPAGAQSVMQENRQGNDAMFKCVAEIDLIGTKLCPIEDARSMTWRFRHSKYVNMPLTPRAPDDTQVYR